jgi:hypothetical protein
VTKAAAGTAGQWKNWYWICFGGIIFFLLSIPLVRGRWKPSDARRDEQEHEAMVAAELAKLALSRSGVREATVSSGNGLYDRTDGGHASQ